MSDCRSDEGITVGLIDSLIFISRVLAPRFREVDNQSQDVLEALKDLAQDEDFQMIDYLSMRALNDG